MRLLIPCSCFVVYVFISKTIFANVSFVQYSIFMQTYSREPYFRDSRESYFHDLREPYFRDSKEPYFRVKDTSNEWWLAVWLLTTNLKTFHHYFLDIEYCYSNEILTFKGVYCYFTAIHCEYDDISLRVNCSAGQLHLFTLTVFGDIFHRTLRHCRRLRLLFLALSDSYSSWLQVSTSLIKLSG